MPIGKIGTFAPFYLLYLFVASVFTMDASVRAYLAFGLFILYILFLLLLIGSACHLQLRRLNNPTVYILTSAIIYILVLTLMGYNNVDLSGLEKIRFFSTSIAGFIVVLFSFLVFDSNDKSERMIILFAFTLLLYSLYKTLVESSLVQARLSDAGIVTNWALIFTGSIPFLFLIKNRKLQIAFLILVVLGAVLGGKRSGVLSVILVLGFVSIYYTLRYGLSLFNKNISLTIYAGIAIGVTLYILSGMSLQIENILFRFDNIQMDGGSGRIVIWSQVIDYLTSTPREYLIFGAGPRYYSLGINQHFSSSHNDLLEFAVSYGLLGVLLFIFILYRLLSLLLFHVRFKTRYEFFSIGLVLTFLIFSTFSGVFIYYSYYISIFVGIALMEIDRQSLKCKFK